MSVRRKTQGIPILKRAAVLDAEEAAKWVGDDCGWRPKNEKPSRTGLKVHHRKGELPCGNCLSYARAYGKRKSRESRVRKEL